MEEIRGKDTVMFMQGEIAGLELALRVIIERSPEIQETLATVASRLAPELSKNSAEDFQAGWYYCLRRLRGGGPMPVLGLVPD